MTLPPVGTSCLITTPGEWLRSTVTVPATVLAHRPPYLRLEDAEGVPHYRLPEQVEVLETTTPPTGFGPLFEVCA